MDCTPGDPDEDGRTSPADAVAVLRAGGDALFGAPASARMLCTGDLNRDGVLGSSDAVAVLRRVVGLDRATGSHATTASIALQDRDEAIALRIDDAAAAEVLLAIGDARFAGSNMTEGDGVVVSRTNGGRLAVLAAHTGATDRVIELRFEGRASVAIERAHAFDAAGDHLRTRFDRAPVRRVPASDRFLGAFPNPFNPSTRLRFALDAPATVRFEIVDATGRRVRTIVHEAAAGEGEVVWRGLDDQGRSVASGVYFVRMVGDHGVSTGRVTLLE